MHRRSLTLLTDATEVRGLTPSGVHPSDPPAGGDDDALLGGRAPYVGPYRLFSELASGGMASVYLALHRTAASASECRALKRIRPDLAADAELYAMFVDEARIASRVRHPSVCRTLDTGRAADGSYYIVMEFLRGETLACVNTALDRLGPRSSNARLPLLAARVFAGLAEGLHAAHTARDEHGAALEIIHRDATPQNLFVLYDGSVRVSDFGIAHARARLHRTRGNKLKGRLAYVAPEQLARAVPDRRIDVWSLGVVLWEFLSGERLFREPSEEATLRAVVAKPIVPPSRHNPRVPPELDRVVLRCLARERDQRFGSAQQLARELHAIGERFEAGDLAAWMAELYPYGALRFDAVLDAIDELWRAAGRQRRVGVTEGEALPLARPLRGRPADPVRAEPASAGGWANWKSLSRLFRR